MGMPKMTAVAKTPATQFPPLELVDRPYVPTPQATYYFVYTQQTMREKHMRGTYDPRIRPIKLGNRLLWPVAGIKAVLGVQ